MSLIDGIEQDTSITVAFDDIPEDGLNRPLRLEKVANEVFFMIMFFNFSGLKLYTNKKKIHVHKILFSVPFVVLADNYIMFRQA